MVCMENFRISQMQDKLTASFHVKRPCLTRIPPCGLIYFHFQTQWMNDQCCRSNLWVLNKSIHGLSSIDIKTFRVQDCLYMGWMFIFLCPVLSWLWCPVKQKVNLPHLTSAKQHPNPQRLLWLISEKSDEQNLQMKEFTVYHELRMNIFMTGSHSHLHPWTKQLQGLQSDPSSSLLQDP